MDDQPTQPTSKSRPLTLFAGGCLGILYLSLCVLGIIFGRTQLTAKNSPTTTVTSTPIPHILVHPPADEKSVLHEDFSSNARDWGLYYHNGKIQIINGKLILQSDIPNILAVGTSRQVVPTGEKYYVQADFSTDSTTVFPYGLIFGLNRSLATYYMFEIMPRNTGFRLSKFNAGKWTELVPYTRAELSSYPQATTLSVYFDHGHIQLYINGEMVSDYSDGDFFQSKDVGVFVSDPGYRLFVDDFFIYGEK